MRPLSERLKFVLQHAKLYTDLGDLNIAVELQPGTIEDAIKHNKKLPVDVLVKIGRIMPEFSIDWLLTGEGRPYLSDRPQKDMYGIAYDELKNELNNINSDTMPHSEAGNAEFVGVAAKAFDDVTFPVRFFEVTPTATFQEFCAGMSEEPDTTYFIPRPNDQLDESYCVFEVYGDSMAPQIQSHARVLCQEIQSSRWHYISECVIVIAYKDRFVIKRVDINNLSTENYMILSSDNPDYPDREKVWRNEIRAIFRAKRIISSDIV